MIYESESMEQKRIGEMRHQFNMNEHSAEITIIIKANTEELKNKIANSIYLEGGSEITFHTLALKNTQPKVYHHHIVCDIN